MRRIALFLVSFHLAIGCTKPPAASTTDPGSANGGDQAAATTGAAPEGDGAGAEAAADLPEAEAVLADAVEALGGREAIDNIKSFYSEAKMKIPAQQISADIRTWWKDGNFYIENDMAGVGLTRMWRNGDEMWSDDPINGKRKLEGKEAAQSLWSASLTLAADWKQYFETAKTIGTRTEGDAELIDVELTDKDGTKLTLSFDRESKLPVQQSFTQETPMGNIPVRVSMEDYKEVAGVKTSFKSVTSMSVVEAVQTLEKFDANVDIDDAKFTPK